MPDIYVCPGWACTDCTVLLANGEAPAEMTDGQREEWLEVIHERNDGYQITLGLASDEHACADEAGQTEADRGGECDCETTAFTWSACDVCGSNLGGERHAVSFFQKAA